MGVIIEGTGIHESKTSGFFGRDLGMHSSCVCKKEQCKGKEERVLMGPITKLVDIMNPMYMQKTNLNKLKEIFQKLSQLAYT